MPIYQSRSPILHNYWLTKYGIQGAYGHFPVELRNLEAAVRGLSALGLAGCNITLPHKVQAMKMMDHIDPLAQRMGAINCIVVQENGALHGFNHDGYGYIQSVKDAKSDWRADEGPILVLGAGGAARAILLSLVDAGAKEIRLVNRTLSKAQELTSGLLCLNAEMCLSMRLSRVTQLYQVVELRTAAMAENALVMDFMKH